jgi:MFS family permease
VAHGVISGAYFTTSASLGQRLFPHSTFAQFASAAGLISAIVTIAVSPLFGKILDISGHQYRYTYLMSFILTALATLLMLVVYRQFVSRGGPKCYVAPN